MDEADYGNVSSPGAELTVMEAFQILLSNWMPRDVIADLTLERPDLVKLFELPPGGPGLKCRRIAICVGARDCVDVRAIIGTTSRQTTPQTFAGSADLPQLVAMQILDHPSKVHMGDIPEWRRPFHGLVC
jgi:hypothetical protein